MQTLSTEDYLKAIYHVSQSSSGAVATTSIAKQIGAKPSSVTDMFKKLSDQNLVKYQKYNGVSLTNEGIKTALRIIRKHRLWESFLVSHLNFNWDEVHQVAEQLEHIQSEKLTNELERFLDYPTHDPHGDPIPNRALFMKKYSKILLTELPVNKEGVCIGVKDNSSGFLRYLDRRQIGIGTTLQVLHREDFDDSLHIQAGKSTLMITKKTAENIYVKP
ncbi:MAG: metal-dependent transcriptional regulator [Bacteroidota bacterium]|nr:metal-dependent transcriptional regulator [Bacteroidota bacterium]